LACPLAKTKGGRMSQSIDELRAKNKSGWLAAGLNILLPGLGYIYCGRVFLGVVVLPFVLGLVYVMPPAALTIWAILVIDGFLAAGRYNKTLDQKINSAMKTCPQCAEKILPEARVCKHCGFNIA